MESSPAPAQRLRDLIQEVANIPDVVSRAQAATDLGNALVEQKKTLSEIRLYAVHLMRKQGLSYEEIGSALGISKARAQQLANRIGQPKRAGVIENEIQILADERRKDGAGDEEVIRTLMPNVLGRVGGSALSPQKIARALRVNTGAVEVWLAEHPLPEKKTKGK